MPIEPKRIKLNSETPSAKKVKMIPLPPINTKEYDIEVESDHFFDKDKPLEDTIKINENNQTNNS